MAANRFQSGEFDPSAYFTTGYNKYKDRVWLRKASAPSYAQPGTVVKNIDYTKMALPKVTWQTGYGPDRTEESEKAEKLRIKNEALKTRNAQWVDWKKKNPTGSRSQFNVLYDETSDYDVNKKYQQNTNAQIQAGIPNQAKAPTSAYGSTLTDQELTKVQARFKPLKTASQRYDETAKMITERAKYDKDLGREKGEYSKYLSNYQSAFDALKKSLGQT
jgi:hypothetical protein